MGARGSALQGAGGGVQVRAVTSWPHGREKKRQSTTSGRRGQGAAGNCGVEVPSWRGSGKEPSGTEEGVSLQKMI